MSTEKLLTKIPTNESQLYAVLFKKVDATVVPSIAYSGLIKEEPHFKDVIPLKCSEGLVESPIVYRKGTDKEILDKVLYIAKNIPKGSILEKLTKELGVKLVEANDADYNIYRSWLKEAEQKGWLDEIRKYQNKR